MLFGATGRLAHVAVASALALSTTTVAYGESLTLPLSAEQIRRVATSERITTVEGFLAALPMPMKESFVLMHASASLHQANPTQPRQIMFGPDARFLLAASGVPDDPRYMSLEFAEFDPGSGLYRFGTIDFDPEGREAPTVHRDVPMCGACHGVPARPIWDKYPDWRGAYSDNEGKVAASEQAAFAAFSREATTSPRYRHLQFTSDAGGTIFSLFGRRYTIANTSFNHELGNTVAVGTVTRMRTHPSFSRWRWAMLAASPSLNCIDSDSWPEIVRDINSAYAGDVERRYPPTTRPAVKAHRLLGIDPVADLSLERLATQTAGGSSGYWQTGAFRIDEAVTFLLLLDAFATDRELAAMFSGQQETIDFISRYMRLTGVERADALKRSYAWYPFFDVFDPLIEDERRLEQVCARLLTQMGS